MANSKGRTGRNPLSYLGVEAPTPPNFVVEPRDPTQNDYIEFNLGDIWLNETINAVWMLVDKSAYVATWIMFGTGGGIQTITGDVGGAVPPDGANNINLLGTAGQIVVTGNPGANTLTLTVGGSVALQFDGDIGSAVPAANILNIIADNASNNSGSTVLTAAAGNSVVLNVSDSVNLNTFIGLNAGNLAITTGADNTGLGVGAVNSITSGDRNSALGKQSLTSLTSGSDNTAVGALSLQSLTTGDTNTAVGVAALNSVTTTSSNTAVGFSALSSSTGSGNTAVGDSALANSTSATVNTAVGALSLQLNTTGSGNTGVGWASLQFMDTGTDNTAVGWSSQASANTAAAVHNTSLGSSSLASLTTGDSNTAVGFSSLNGLLTGTDNIAIGNSSGLNYVGAETNNIIIGNAGAAAENTTIRIGTTGTHTRNFQAGIAGVVVPNTLNVVIDSTNGQLGTTVLPSGTESSFFARLGSNQTNVTGDSTVVSVIFDTEVFDLNNDYNNVTGIFTAPVDGIYIFCAGISFNNLAGHDFGNYALGIVAPNGTFFWRQAPNTVAQQNFLGSNIVQLSMGDTAQIIVQVGDPANPKDVDIMATFGSTTAETFFSGCLLIEQ